MSELNLKDNPFKVFTPEGMSAFFDERRPVWTDT